MMTRPDRTEAADYYFNYINQVPDGDICDTLDAQLSEVVDLFGRVSDEQSLHRYAAGKWTIREVASHVSDTERVFAFRAFWFARAFDSALPSFDQQVAVDAAHANIRSWRSHIDEFRSVREATLSLFRHLPAEAWTRRGVASNNPFSVRALAFLTAGHASHHVRILRDQYLPAL